jgi:hypothetical protein
MRHEILHLEWSHLESLLREINIDEDGFSLYGFQCMLNVDTNHGNLEWLERVNIARKELRRTK